MTQQIELLKERLEQLIDCEALELLRCAEQDPDDIYIPYMMNDAVELYAVLTHCTAVGELSAYFPVGTQVTGAETDGQYHVTLYRPDGTCLTLQFAACRWEEQYYPYHEIGHFWREGDEQWRQLVYQIGTMYDKYQYLGDRSCNAQEKALLPLVTFAPFRYWSPVHESLEDWYPDTEQGTDCMEHLARQAGDTAYLAEIQRYRQTQDAAPLIAMMQQPERGALYQTICQAVERASSCYPPRDYGVVLYTKMQAQRKAVQTLLHAHGFSGDYPRFRRGNTQVVAVEEHPYTVFGLEYEGFAFGIRLMVSETKQPSAVWNAGFFEHTGRVLTQDELSAWLEEELGNC